MNKIVKFIITIFFIFMSGSNLFGNEYKPPEYVFYVKQIRNAFADEISRNLGLNCVGVGSSMPRDVEEIEVLFTTNRRATIEEARAMEVHAGERFLNLINSHEKLRPFLREYPFTPARISVNISFVNDAQGHISDGTVTYVSIINGQIYYRANDPITDDLIVIHIEPYEEARAIVQKNPSQNLLVHQPSPYEVHLDKLFKDFAREVKKKYGLNCYREGGKLANGIEEIAFHFMTPKKTSLEKARELEVKITERLLKIVNADELIRPYFKEYPFTASRAKVGITIQKGPYDYHTDGSVAKVVPQDGKLVYLGMRPATKTRFPVRPDIVICEESFEDAKSLIQRDR